MLMALQMSSFVPPALMEWSLACVLFAPVVFLVVQTEAVSRKRMALALLVALVAAAAGISAAGAQTPLNACYGLERYSAEWWAVGCWVLDLMIW